MRSLRFLTSLSLSVATFALAGATLAAPTATRTSGLTLKTSAFAQLAAPLAEKPSRVDAIRAATSVLSIEVPDLDRITWGEARVTSLASGDHIVKLPQVHAGLPVAHRGATVTFRNGETRVVATNIERQFPESRTPVIAESAALGLAEARTGIGSSEPAVLAWWPTPEGVRLVWAIAADAITGVPYRPLTVVDAQTGTIVYSYNTVLSLNQAKVFPSNPLKSPGLIDVTLPVGAGETTLQNGLVQSLNCVDQKTVKNVNIMGFALDVHTCDLLQTAAPDANGDFTDVPAADTAPEDSYAEISMFYHANRGYEMFRAWDPNLNVNGGDVFPTVSNLRIPQGFDTFDLAKIKDPDLPLTPFQNAFYSPANPLFSAVFGLNGGAMWFGQGPVKDYSYDGDVVYHELTHAVVDATIKFVGNPHLDEFGVVFSPGGMNEGLADYFSSALTGDPDVGEYASKDFDPSLNAIRSLSNPDACPTAIGGEVHQDATLFSGGLWDVRKTLNPDEQVKLDLAVFTAMNVAPTGDLAYEEMAELIGNEVKTGVSEAAATALTEAWTTRGVLPKCTRVLEFTGTTLKGPQDLQNLWFAPGKQTTGVQNSAGKWTPGVVQAHWALPADTIRITVDIREVMIGGGFGFGGGDPFKPKLLVRFASEPIQFKYGPFEPTTGDVLTFDMNKAGNNHSVTVDVPVGATDAWVMIGSVGDVDGAYTDMALSAEKGMGGVGGAGGGGVGGGVGGTGGDGGGTGNDDKVVTGCGCTVPGDSDAPTNIGFGALAALGLAAAGLRRKSKQSRS